MTAPHSADPAFHYGTFHVTDDARYFFTCTCGWKGEATRSDWVAEGDFWGHSDDGDDDEDVE